MDADTRRLVFSVAGLAVLLFVGRAVIGSVWDDTDLRRTNLGLRRSLASGGDAAQRPAREDREAAARRVVELRERLDELLPKVHYVRPPAFDVPAGASPDLAYIEVLRREQGELVQGARYVGKSVPQDLGMPVPNPTGLEDVLDTLRALHVVQIVVSSALRHDVVAVDAIRVPPARRGRLTEGGFLRPRPVEFDLVGSPDALRDTLAEICSVRAEQPWLALDDVRFEALDEDGERARCRLSVSSLDVEQDAGSAEAGGR